MLHVEHVPDNLLSVAFDFMLKACFCHASRTDTKAAFDYTGRFKGDHNTSESKIRYTVNLYVLMLGFESAAIQSSYQRHIFKNINFKYFKKLLIHQQSLDSVYQRMFRKRLLQLENR